MMPFLRGFPMRLPILPALLCCTLSAPAVPAQTLSDQDLLALFQRQRDTFRAAAEGGQGATRGLKLVTLDGTGAPPAAPGAAPAALAVPDLAAVAPALPGAEVGLPVTGQRPGLAEPTAPDRILTGAQQPATPPATTEEATQVSAVPGTFGLFDPELQVNVRIRFDFDSATLGPDQKPLLAQLCRVMTSSDIGLFQIVGHTDAAGTDAYNENLSRLRAEEVQRYLVTDCGIAPARLRAVGMGERFLSDSANPRSGENRRVEFQALG